MCVISGPGGVGKGSVVARLLEHVPGLQLSVSATTRAPRPGEVDGRHYHFLSDEHFDALVAADEFLEWAEFAGRRYGTPWSSVREALAAGADVILEIEVQGALQVRERFPDALLIFLEPPDVDALVERLRSRGTDSEARIRERMAIARWEMSQAGAFDACVVNADLERAVSQIARILASGPVN